MEKPLFGCFVDIRQQDGSLVRMNYSMTKENTRFCTWAGIMEQTADKFQGVRNEPEKNK